MNNSGSWLPAGEAAAALGITRENLRRKAVAGKRRRKQIGGTPNFLYFVEKPSSVPNIDKEEKTEGIACYMPARDYYMVSKDGRRRPQIIEGWIGRKILEIENKKFEGMESIDIKKPPRLPRLNIKAKDGGFSVCVGLTDFHFGKFGGAESGDHYNREIARERLMSKCEELINLVLRFGQPDQWVIPVGSDFFNFDDDAGNTTKGTGVDSDSTFQTMFTEGVQLFTDFVEALRCICSNVSLVFMPGNHDRTSSLALLQIVKAIFKDSPDVRIYDEPRERQYLLIGSTLIGFTHGDGARIADMPALMSSEARELWHAKHKIVFTGHLHHERVLETKSGVMCYQMPSLAGHDRYHYRGGWTTSRKSIAVYLIDPNAGVIGQLNAVA